MTVRPRRQASMLDCYGTQTKRQDLGSRVELAEADAIIRRLAMNAFTIPPHVSFTTAGTEGNKTKQENLKSEVRDMKLE